MESSRSLINVLNDEMIHKIKGGIYNKLQVDFAYNSNHIEGSKLTHEQTRWIYDTNSIAGENIHVNDILETLNHFRCFDYIIGSYEQPLTENYIKELHRILKSGTISSSSSEAVVGDYKKYANTAGELLTVKPQRVSIEIRHLLDKYNSLSKVTLEDIAIFHSDYEKIHPFYDGNGRTGRLIVFKECLRNNIVPVIINDNDKIFYYKGLYKHQSTGDLRQLIAVFQLMQDDMKSILDYFEIKYEK